MAMVEQRPAKIGPEAVMEYWEETSEGSPYWSVWWNSRQKAKQFNKDDFEESKVFLERWLELNNDPNDTILHYLVIHPKAEAAYNNRSDQVESFPFRFNESFALAGIGNMNGGGGQWGIMQAITGLKTSLDTRFKEFDERLSGIEAGGGEGDMWGKINGLLENPNVGPLIAQTIAGLIAKVTNQQFQPQRVAINGVPGSNASSQKIAGTAGNQETDEQYAQRVNDALVRLQDHCDLAADLELLANMADKNPGQFKMLLGMLRA
jgi:hypothetical protein